MSDETPAARRFSRRQVLSAGAVAGAGLAVGAVGFATFESLSAEEDKSLPATVPFWGEHQAGIGTPAQNYLHFASFDLTTAKREDVAQMLREWTEAAARMCEGDTAAELSEVPIKPPEDTGEALGHSAARLTLTFGFGPTLFEKDGVDRYGLAARRPEALVDLPHFRLDEIQPRRSDGDICVQACADDPQVAFHAVRNLIRIGRGTAVLRWSQLGFNRTASTHRSQETPRNLMGFKDGTNNIHAEDEHVMQNRVWVGEEGPGWMEGGSYVVTRRIRMTIEHWDRTGLGEQERTIGRTKIEGGPLSGGEEFTPVDLAAKGEDGEPKIAINAHIRRAAVAHIDGGFILRRGYSFTDGMDSVIGQLDAGLFFIAFQRDVSRQFIPLQETLAADDLLNEYIVHTGSAVFACPPGVQSGDWVGRSLFEA